MRDPQFSLKTHRAKPLDREIEAVVSISIPRWRGQHENDLFAGNLLRVACVAVAVFGFRAIAQAQGEGVASRRRIELTGGMTDQLAYRNSRLTGGARAE